MENLYAKFMVTVGDNEWSHQGKSESAEMKIQLPRQVLENIDSGNLFVGVLQAALVNFDSEEIDE